MAKNELCTVEKLRAILSTTKPPKMYLKPQTIEILKKFRVGETTTEAILENINEIGTFSDAQGVLIYPRIYIGDEKAARNLPYLKKNNFKWILNTAQGTKIDQVKTTAEDYKGYDINFLGLNMVDTDQESLLEHTDHAIKFIDKALEKDGNILIHCMFGMCRSVSITAAFLIARKNFTAEEALRTIAQQKQISLNNTFLQQLCDLDNKLRDTSSVTDQLSAE